MKYTLILTLLIVSILFHEQSTEFLIKNFGHEQGLGEVKVHGIYQDKDMFLWFATGTGLYQFNGHRFYHSSNDSLLKKRWIRSISSSSNGMLSVSSHFHIPSQNNEGSTIDTFFSITSKFPKLSMTYKTGYG